MIFDCFTYFNEKELLELRIKLLYDYVDKFIIVDADKTYKGEAKDFTCQNTLSELNISTDKIQIIEIKLPSYNNEPSPWVRERMQRNIISDYITQNDICIISDCDEIINPKNIKHYINTAITYPNNILRIPMVFLMNRADLRVYDNKNNPMVWTAPSICLKHHLYDYSISEIRESNALNLHNIKYADIFITENNNIEEAGWHFSWMGGGERMKMKYKSFMHYQDNIPMAAGNGDKIELENFIGSHKVADGSVDPLGRANHIMKKYEIKELPKKIFELPKVEQFLFAE